MSNRARREHTHALRRRLLPDPRPTFNLSLKLDDRRPLRQLKGIEARLTPQPDRSSLH